MNGTQSSEVIFTAVKVIKRVCDEHFYNKCKGCPFTKINSFTKKKECEIDRLSIPRYWYFDKQNIIVEDVSRLARIKKAIIEFARTNIIEAKFQIQDTCFGFKITTADFIFIISLILLCKFL